MRIKACQRGLAGGLVVGLAMLFAVPLATAQARVGLENLSATRVYGVDDAPAIQAQELPPVEPFFDASLWHRQGDQDLLSPASSMDFSFADFSLSGSQTASLARSIQYSQQSSPIWSARWLSSAPDQVWQFGERNWRYVNGEGLQLTLGNDTVTAPDWARPVELGGVNISQQFEQGPAGPWRYALAIGALDMSGKQDNGDLVYGSSASSLMVSTDLTSRTSLDTQMESARDFGLTGLGATYRSPDFGVWQASVAKASHSVGQGWRYQAAYGLDVLGDLQLQWQGERYQDNFLDLSRYQGMKVAAASSRQMLGLSVPLRGWGEVKTQYEVQQVVAGGENRYLGVTQQFWYSPHLRVGLQARRHLESRQSNIALRFSIPIF